MKNELKEVLNIIKLIYRNKETFPEKVNILNRKKVK